MIVSCIQCCIYDCFLRFDVKNSFRFEGATTDAHETILTVADPTADRTVTIPDATTTLVGTDTTQTLTNKTITDAASISIANTTTSDSLLLTTTEDSSTAGPVLTLKRNSASPDDADYLGQIKFKGENDADQETVYAKITGKILVVIYGLLLLDNSRHIRLLSKNDL